MRAATANMRLTPDSSWNPGPLASGHAGFGGNCAACHETPFLRVRDRTLPQVPRQDSRPRACPCRLQIELFGGTRCATCHADHKGPDGLVRRDCRHVRRMSPGPEAPAARHATWPTSATSPRRIRNSAHALGRARQHGHGARRAKRQGAPGRAVASQVSARRAPEAEHPRTQGPRHARLRQLPRARRLRPLVRPHRHEQALPRVPHARVRAGRDASGRCRMARWTT